MAAAAILKSVKEQ